MKKKTGMSWKNISKKQKIFQLVNTIVVVAILATYVGRLFYWKAVFDKRNQTNVAATSLSDLLINKTSLTTINNGLVKEEDESYTFKGDVKDNYLSFDNMIYRILGIDSEGRIRVVSNDSAISFSMAGFDSFESSALKTYLNNDYLKGSIVTNFNYLVNTSLCNDKVDNVNSIGCNIKFEENDITILSLDDYKKAGAAQSYLNNGKDYWLANTDSDGNFWFVDDNGNLSIDKTDAVYHGVRYVLTLNFLVKAASGEGTMENPYVVESSEVKTLSDVRSGQYVSYSDSIWRASLNLENGVVAILDGYLPEMQVFGKTNEFNLTSGIGKTLNTTFLKTLDNYQNYLVENTWTVGKFDNFGKYDYRDLNDVQYQSYVTIPDVRYPGFDDYRDAFVSCQSYETTKASYIVTENHSLYATLLDTKMYVRPMVCFNKDVKVVSGLGTQDNPFILEVIQ